MTAVKWNERKLSCVHRRTLETLGPAFIKWGQWAATRRDVFPPDLCKELERLHSQAPQHSLHFTHSAIRRAFAGTSEDLFQQFEERPVASGSIAQVYRARLSQKGALHTGMDAGRCTRPACYPSTHWGNLALSGVQIGSARNITILTSFIAFPRPLQSSQS